MSPRELTSAVQRRARLSRSSDIPSPSWHRIVAGPLAGAELYLAPEAVDTWRAMIAGTHDQFLFDAAVVSGPLDGKVCWDIGAHIGYHSLAFASLVGAGGQVVAFEPNPFNLSRMDMHLTRNPTLASRISVKTIALSDSSGVAEFRFSDDVESSISSGGHLTSALAPCDPWVYESFGRTQVKTATIDELVGSGEIAAPDVMKIDVEGAEAAVIRGGKEVIRLRRPILLVEVHHILQMLEVCQLLIGWGYRLEVLDREDAGPGRCFIMGRPDSP
jgi:FkbM family methyltransferase